MSGLAHSLSARSMGLGAATAAAVAAAGGAGGSGVGAGSGGVIKAFVDPYGRWLRRLLP